MGRVYLMIALVVCVLACVQQQQHAAQGMRLSRRVTYWPGMWDSDSDGWDKRSYYWPGMWQWHSQEPEEKRSYYWPGMWRQEQPSPPKRSFYWPGMWQYHHGDDADADSFYASRGGKRAMSYDYYWLGKACGEAGDLAACRLLFGWRG